MKTKLLPLLFLLLISSLSAFAADGFIEITSVPVEMKLSGKTVIEVPATVPEGMEIDRVVIYLKPIAKKSSSEYLFRAMRWDTNSLPAPKLEAPKTPPPTDRKLLKDISFGEEPIFRFKDEPRPFLWVSFKLGK